ncbi:MAG: isoleucine--tRNA ligase, partial [Planctomycetota bacterium]
MGKKDKYRDTLMLPKTSFNMRAGLMELEPRLQKRWKGFDLYRRTLDAGHPNGKFVFHDGPPYANGSIHLGHLLNKLLKDFVVRSRQMSGFEVDYVPGWDCHGLPIEHRVMKELGSQVETMTTQEIRKRCAKYAGKYMKLQAKQLMRLGTMADYDHPYYTMDRAYEGAVLDVFTALVEHGLAYRDLKPVHWSIENRTALAEAELEYYDREDTSVFVLFNVPDPSVLPAGLNAPDGATVSLMIWTTTPWTLPANLAVAVAAGADYGLFPVERPDGTHHVVLADGMQQAVLGTDADPVGRVKGAELVESGAVYQHPFLERKSPLVAADYVTLEDGTGLVHTAPGHGADDYHTGMKHGLDIYCPVQGDGTFDDTVPEWLTGLDVWSANPVITERLRESGHLFRDEKFTHSYPHDWRGKTPTIFRATEQWFVAVDKPFGDESKSLRERMLRAAGEEITFVPDWGRKRLAGMVESRPDWCISRQRTWGLPIPAFVTPAGETVLTAKSVAAVADYVREHGSDAWFRDEPREMLAAWDVKNDPDAPVGVDVATLDKGGDIFDVWFESGSSWNGVLNARDMGYPADLYLEGSDQHRGWFQLSLLPALGKTGVSPFKTVLTHGF